MGSMLEKIRQDRIEKIGKLRKLGSEPYPSKVERTNTSVEIVKNFQKFEGKTVTIVGRVMSWRSLGKLTFSKITDFFGEIQVVLREENLKGSLDFVKLCDIGDFIEVTGLVVKTKTGEISVDASKFRIISKSIRPLPEKWSGLKDDDIRFRRRYLDMVMNPDVRMRFVRRSNFWKATREFMDNNGFNEINIPVLEHVTGGADARPFVTYYDALGEEFYLRISHELPLKRLLGGGFEKVYDVGVRFRNEGIDDEHLPEHIAMEFYWAYANYEDGMKFTEDMFRFILKKVYGTLQFNIRGFKIDLNSEWKRYQFEDLLKEKYKGIDIYNDSEQELMKYVKEAGLEIAGDLNRSRIVDYLWKEIRKGIAGPVFVIGIPKFFSPLSKLDPKDDRKVERFFPIIAGSELANAFSELNDPVDQLDRFVEQQKLRDSGDEEAQMLDIDFVEMLEYGMPPAVGFGMSERVFWFFEGVTAKEGVPFPQLKTEYERSTLEIYSDIRKYFEKKPIENTLAKILPKKASNEISQDKTKRFIIVVNNEVKGWQLTNTIGHIGVYLGNRLDKSSVVSTDSFTTKDDKKIPADSQYPVITMSANPGQMSNLLEKVQETSGIEYLAFTQDMIDLNDDIGVANAIKEQGFKELKICGIGIFGPNDLLKELTKKFSLYKG